MKVSCYGPKPLIGLDAWRLVRIIARSACHRLPSDRRLLHHRLHHLSRGPKLSPGGPRLCSRMGQLALPPPRPVRLILDRDLTASQLHLKSCPPEARRGFITGICPPRPQTPFILRLVNHRPPHIGAAACRILPIRRINAAQSHHVPAITYLEYTCG